MLYCNNELSALGQENNAIITSPRKMEFHELFNSTFDNASVLKIGRKETQKRSRIKKSEKFTLWNNTISDPENLIKTLSNISNNDESADRLTPLKRDILKP